MKLITSYTIILILIISIVIIIVEFNNIKKTLKRAFECGFNVSSEKKSIFSTNFLIIIILFLVFDIEVSILIPTIIVNKIITILLALLSIVFLIFLTLILLKEWLQGSLEWNK